jgi:predicted AlkP superfamily pyrophosphatase or phosphodiesterase
MAKVRHIVDQFIRRFEAGALSALLAALLLLGATAGMPGQSQSAKSERHVVVVSIDGLGATWLEPGQTRAKIPNLHLLMEQGSYAQGVVGVYPSVTYPSHTTIATGRTPAEHGIHSNVSATEWGKNPNDWYWYTKAIKVPTLWDVARENKLTTSTIFWPVTVGGQINWNIPEIWDPNKPMGGDPMYIGQYATPGLLFDAALELGALPAGSDDAIKVKLAAFVLKKHQPNLLMLHLTEFDSAQHKHGPASAEAVATIEKEDTRIGEMLAALKALGLENSTDLFVVSDHGFFPVNRVIYPNALLAKAGLLSLDERGYITGGKVFTVADGGSFFISWPESQDLRGEVSATLEPLRDAGILYAELGHPAVTELGAEPAVQLALEAPEGAAFDGKATGEMTRNLAQTTGTHGYLPFRRGMHASFVARGPHIKQGVVLRQIPMTAIAPTLSKALGIDGARLGAQQPLNEIFKSN